MPRPTKKRPNKPTSYRITKIEMSRIVKDLKTYGCDIKDQLNGLKDAEGSMPFAKIIKAALDKVYCDAVTPMI